MRLHVLSICIPRGYTFPAESIFHTRSETMGWTLRTRLAIPALFLAAATTARAGEIAVHSGQTVAFLGDSITAQGAATPVGYVRLVVAGLATAGVQVTPVRAGVSGHTSKDMLARVDRDVIAKRPDWVTISCGVNDVWHGATGVALDPYKRNITEIVDRCQKAGIKVMLLTSTPIGEDAGNDNNAKLVAYNDFLRQLARERGFPLADLNGDMRAALKRRAAEPHPDGMLLTVDGVHMNPLGNRVMATGILRAFGLDEAQVKAAQSKWLDVPAACELPTKATVTLRQYERLDALAAQQHKSVNDLLAQAVSKAVAELTGEAK